LIITTEVPERQYFIIVYLFDQTLFREPTMLNAILGKCLPLKGIIKRYAYPTKLSQLLIM
jgi:hypothetical protein